MAKTEGNRALAVVSLATGLSLLGDTSLYTVLAIHTEEVGVALGSVGLLLSVNRFVRLALNGPIGWLCDRWPRRRLFVPAVLLGAVSTAVYAVSSTFTLLLIGRLLWGVAWAGLWVSGNAIVLDLASSRSRGRRVGIYHLAFFLGAAAGSLLGGVLTDSIGFSRAMWVNASLTGLGGLAALFLLPETRRAPDSQAPRAETVPPLKKQPPPRGQLVSAIALLGINRVVGPGIFFPTFGLFLSGVFGERTTLAGLGLGIATITGLALSGSTLISMAAAPVMGALSDRLESRWTVAALGLVSGVAGFVTMAFSAPMAILLGAPLVSVSSGSNQGLSTALVGDLTARAKQGQQLGLLFTVGDLGSALGPPLAFALLPLVGISALYLACAGLLALMAGIALHWRRRAVPSVTARH
jgi:MFS family permease